MLLAALLQGTAACLGTGCQVKKWSDDTQMVSPNMFLIGTGHSGVGKSPAYKVGFEGPISDLEQRNGIKLIVRKFTPSALLKIQESSKGNGIISSDEVSNSLLIMLKRSEESGEREDLLTAWDGGQISMHYATKEDVHIPRSALSLGGFTQPDKLLHIIEEVLQSNDGFWQRALFWCLPGRRRIMRLTREARTMLNKKFPHLISLGGVFSLMYDLHHSDQEEARVYHLAEEAENLLCSIEDGAQKAMALHGAIMQDPDISTEEDDKIEPIRTTSDSKLAEHVVKMAVNMHVLFCTLECCINNTAGPINVPQEISRQTLQWANTLVMHIMDQMMTIKEGYHIPASSTPSSSDNSTSQSPVKLREEVSLKVQVARYLLLIPGLAVTTRQIIRTKRNVTAQQCVSTMEWLQKNNLGSLISLPRNCKVFYKALPTTHPELDDKLKEVGMLPTKYHQMLAHPMGSYGLEQGTMIQYHPDKDAAIAFVDTLNHVASQPSSQSCDINNQEDSNDTEPTTSSTSGSTSSVDNSTI